MVGTLSVCLFVCLSVRLVCLSVRLKRFDRRTDATPHHLTPSPGIGPRRIVDPLPVLGADVGV